MSESATVNNSFNTARLVMQEAVSKLAAWVGLELEILNRENSKENLAITTAKELFSWNDETKIDTLSLLFDDIQLEEQNQQKTTPKNYSPAIIIKNSLPDIPYPQTSPPTLDNLKQEIKEELSKLKADDFQNLSLLTLVVEKLGSYISYGKQNIAFTDLVKSTAAVASALTNNPDAQNLTLIVGDLSGIQNFIYTISADGALKSLRARSFLVELITEEIVQQLLENLELPRTNVIYSGAGNLYILADDNEKKKRQIANTIRHRFNDHLLKSFQGKLFLALDFLTIPIEALSKDELSNYWKKAPQKLTQQKQRKFANQLNNFLKFEPSYEPCKVCHRDDQRILKPLNKQEENSSSACWLCRTMFELGSRIFKVQAIVRVKKRKHENIDKQDKVNRIVFPKYEYYLYDTVSKALENKAAKSVLLINNWDLDNYQKNEKANQILLGNYAKKTEIEESGFMAAAEMADMAKESGAIPRVGYLRMDVDNLGKIFAKGLGNQQNLPRLAGLSRQMTYFFKVYLNTLAKQQDTLAKQQEQKQKNLLFIYAGGDDLFICGAWNEVVDFSFEIYKSFRKYTGNNPQITLSGGISLANPKYPLYQSADESGNAESNAKGNGKDSLGLFGEVFKWHEWLGKENIDINDLDVNMFKFSSEDMKEAKKAQKYREYLGENINLDLFGIKPLVDQFQELKKDETKIDYSRNFVRNLLITAQTQEQKVADLKSIIKPDTDDDKNNNFNQQINQQIDDVNYYLHLPKIAYTLARLPPYVKKSPQFKLISKSLKSPYNAPYYKAIAIWLELLNRSQ